MTEPITYVYCLVRSARRPPLRALPAPIEAAGPIRLLDAGDGLWAVVSSVPAHEYDEASLERGLQNIDWVGRRAMAHEAVVEHFLSAPALLPMQLFTLFTSDERVLAHVRRDRRRIDAILSRLERHLEWGLRLTFDENAARAAVKSARDASGASYLERKRDLLAVNRVQVAEARAEADRMYRTLARDAADSRRRTATEEAAPGSRLLLDAAFLVPIRRSTAFRAALRRSARALRGAGLVVSLTGPWPAYNFIDAPSRKRVKREGRASR